MLLVKAGSAVDDFIEALLPYLEQGRSLSFPFDEKLIRKAILSSMVEIHISPIPTVAASISLIKGTYNHPFC